MLKQLIHNCVVNFIGIVYTERENFLEFEFNPDTPVSGKLTDFDI